MKIYFPWMNGFVLRLALALCVAACTSGITAQDKQIPIEPLPFGPDITLGRPAANPAEPFLRNHARGHTRPDDSRSRI
jgi:hypothetical protein